ncbi:GNAT family N-acetyltransferase [Sulfurovum sp. AR]|uniref:GNAT family N-acetyltransferase n=1 Tax=Sulfurovum sp. AR TaxID=1165841 RepID=UPI00025C47FB|nr:GNAT family N-acetyltransferase [Sulfurovum sp. AR]EIF51631.1 GCN5-like N-acetyltransferase [Sulfurovum sp. AR]
MQWFFDEEYVNFEILSNLYKIAPLGDKSPEDLKTAFTNSNYKCFVYEEELLIGAGRALADGVDTSYIGDVAVHPDFKGQGLGSAIVRKLVEFSEGHNKIILYSSLGKEAFYAKLGFEKMNTGMAIFRNQDQARKWGLVSTNEISCSL